MSGIPINEPAGSYWRKVAVLILGAAVIGLPINNLTDYALLAAMAMAIFSGEVRLQSGAWLGAGAIVAVALLGQTWLAPPRIDEGHNVFLPNPALEQALPADVYRHLKDEFDREYPPAVRCAPGSIGCWQNGGKYQELPDRPFAFSADGIFHGSKMSRAVTEIDFSDPVWLRLGFINEMKYNWSSAAPDVHRADRDRRFWMGLQRWHLAMPWFEMIRLPAAMVGGRLCWRGDVLWEGAGDRFAPWRGDGCRSIAPDDAGRRVVGIAIKPDALAMRLTPPWPVWWLQLASQTLMIGALAGLVLTLVRFRPQRLVFPCVLIGLAVVVIAIDDASFLGGVRPFDGGDDGLAYDGLGRTILRQLLDGDLWNFLRGDESVYWYSPGLRYFRAFEHIVFGETYLGYLSVILALPFIAHSLFRRFLSKQWALALIILFVAVPLGVLFGTSFVQYEKWASRGFADSAAYIFLIAGILPIVGSTRAGPHPGFVAGFFGALLMSLGVFIKPVICLSAMVLLAGAGIAALYHRQWRRLAGMTIATFPVFWMPFHNWYFGHVFLLFSSNVEESQILVMPPSAYVRVAYQLFAGDFSGLGAVLRQIANWLSGPAESYWTIPLNAAGVAVLIYVVFRGRRFESWLRLIGAAALLQHGVALFYRGDVARYHFLTWFLTMLVVMVFLHDVGMGWFKRRYPVMSERAISHPLSRWLAFGLARLQKASS
jgi:hypothetical protein